jgi:membrane protease YdiL (CAAX protease family)
MSSTPPPFAPPQASPPQRPGPPEPEPAAGEGPDRWPPWSAVGALLAGFAFTLVASLIVVTGGVAISGGDVNDPPGWANIVGLVLQDASFVGASVLFAALALRPRPWHFGLAMPPKVGRAVGLTVAAFVAYAVFATIYLAIVGTSDKQDINKDLGVGDGTGDLIAVAICVCVLAPLAEEFFFRGFIFGALRNWRGPWLSAVITGLLFGGAHALGSPVAFLLPLAVLGGLLCVLRQLTGSLYPGIALHCVNNVIAMAGAEHWHWQAVPVGIGALAVITVVLLVVKRAAGPEPAGAGPEPAAVGVTPS